MERENKDKGVNFPKMFIWCGTEDSLITANRNYSSLLSELGIEHTYLESEGDYSWE